MKFKYLSSLLVIFLSTGLLAQIDESQVHKQYSTGKFFEILKPFQSSQFAVGIQAKGKLANVITNFGQLGQFHVFTPSLNWPAFGEGQDDEQHYGWGVDFMMGYNGDVLESFQDPGSNLISRDWQPADENLYSGNVTVSKNDLTPLMATSDNIDTWPIGDNGEPFWPGIFRQDTEGNTYPGEFTSERDLYCVFTDEGNDKQYGFRVEQTAYSFTRRYAEDFLVFRFNIKNTSQDTLKNIYPGMMLQFLIDFDYHDLINFIDSNNDGEKDFIYMWDEDMTPKEPWSKVGYIGLMVVKSPNPAGITNFHYFHDDFIPSKDEDYWMMLTSDDSMIPDTTRSKYFHGDDKNIDDVSLAPGLDPDGNNKGGKISWIYSLGPLTLNPADSTQMDIAIICGDDEQDLMDNAEWVWYLAGNAWNGPNPPSSPVAQAFAGDGKVTLTWNTGAEKSKDNLTGFEDFEGYKIYRSTDNGRTWGKEITDSRGNFRSFQPLAQFDLKNDISGNDPISNIYLGENSGLKHTFVDSTVVNGMEYWYAVTAYDRGEEGKLESLESSLGLTVDESNVAAAIPQSTPSNLIPGSASGNDYLEPVQGVTNAKVNIEILDPSLLKTRDYKITFQIDSVTTFTLTDANTHDTLLTKQPLTDISGDNLPVIDGFRLTIKDSESGIKYNGWTKVAGDTCTFDWRFESIDPSSNMLIQGEIETFDDWRITVDYNQGLNAHWIDLFTGAVQASKQHLPLKIEIITDPDNPIDASEDTWLGEFAIAGPWEYRKDYYSQLGWDLEPGGLGYLGASSGWYEKHVDVLILEKITTNLVTGDTIPNYLYMFTNNKPDTSYRKDGTLEIISAKAPSQGDEYTILINKPLTNEVVYTFSTYAGSLKESKERDLEDIKVVPNPFFVSSAFNDNIMFTHLPNRCEIDIYNVAGDLVRSINHDNDSGIDNWDLKNDQGLTVAYGLYIYVVKAENGKKQVGKFSIIR